MIWIWSEPSDRRELDRNDAAHQSFRPLRHAAGRPSFLDEGRGSRSGLRDLCPVLLAIGKAASMTNPVFAFWGFRDRIEDAASAKYDRTARVDYEVLTIEERDLTLSEQSAQSARPPRQ
jgi:hypothetical protein